VSLLVLCVQFLSFAPAADAADPEKPRIAIKAPRMVEGADPRVADGPYLPILLEEMEASLRATRKFELLTRQAGHLKEVREEQRFAKSEASKGNAAQEGQLEAAHYLVIPVVQEFQFRREGKPVPNIPNKYMVTDKGVLRVSAQVIDTARGQIKSTLRLRGSFASDSRVANTSEGAPSTDDFTKMAQAVAAQMADQLIDAVFPMQVLRVVDTQVWINRGEDGGLSKGDVLTVYKPGAELIDPYTKERLGSTEIAIGEIAVRLVNPKFTTAEVVTTSLKEPIKPGFIVRRAKP
jgi:hypothetical protein